jgi:hypothetical protein
LKFLVDFELRLADSVIGPLAGRCDRRQGDSKDSVDGAVAGLDHDPSFVFGADGRPALLGRICNCLSWGHRLGLGDAAEFAPGSKPFA